MNTNKSKFRLLPIIIFLCVIIFSLKLENLWEERSVNNNKISLISVTTAQAQENKAEQESQDLQNTTDSNTGTESTPNINTVSTNPENLLQTIENPDNQIYSDSEIDVLQSLSSRRSKIEEQEKELAVKIAMLNAAEMQIDKKIQKLKNLESSIKQLVITYDEQEESKMKSLVTIYSSMKPKDAARIFNDLDMDILIKLFSQMKETKAAVILSAMDVGKANALTLELANKNRPDFISK